MDALVEKVTLRAIHEKGEERLLTWKWLNETQHQIRMPTGETAAEVVKNQPAVALKVGTVAQIDRIIGFQDLEFETNNRRMMAELRQQYEYLKETTPVGDVIDVLIKSKEFFGIRDWFVDNMYWKEGQYRFEVALQEVRLRSPHVECFQVVVSRADVEKLRANTCRLEGFVRGSLLKSEGITAGIAAPTWNWVYCPVARLR
jgi:hypothetical protein